MQYITQSTLSKPKKKFLIVNKKNTIHPPLFFNNSNVFQTTFRKHLGVILDARLTFVEHFKLILGKTNKIFIATFT